MSRSPDQLFWLAADLLQRVSWVLALVGLAYLLFLLNRRHQSRWSKAGLVLALVDLALGGLRTLWGLFVTVLIELNPGVVLGWMSKLPDQFWAALATVHVVIGLAAALCLLVIAIEARQQEQVAESGRSG